MNGLISSRAPYVPKHGAPRPTKRYVPRHAAPRSIAARVLLDPVVVVFHLIDVVWQGLRRVLPSSVWAATGRRLGRARNAFPAGVTVTLWTRFMMGFASGVGATAMVVPTLGLKLFTAQLGIPVGIIIDLAQAAPLAIAMMMWRFVRRGGMIPRLAVTGLWALAALGLFGIALLPTHGWVSVPIVTACMAAVGAGVSAGYHVQSNKLGEIGETEPHRPAHRRRRRRRVLADGGRGASPGQPARATAVTTAAALAQLPTLLLQVASGLILAWAMEHYGIRVAIAGLAVAVAIFALLYIIWSGLPDAKPGIGKGGVAAVADQNQKVKDDLLGNGLLYGAWGGVLYPLLALLGAGPVIQATISGLARVTAAGFMARLARVSDTGHRRILVITANVAIGGAILLALARSTFDWALAGLGVATVEIGCNGVGNTLKGSLGEDRSPERVRRMQAGTLYRFAGSGLASLLLANAWLLVSHYSVMGARVIEAGFLVALLVAVRRIVPREAMRDGRHPLKAEANLGKLFVALLPARAGADRRWFYVGVAGGHRDRWRDQFGQERKPSWEFFWLRQGGQLNVVSAPDDADESLLLRFRLEDRWLRPCHLVSRTVEIPLKRSLPGRQLKLMDANGRGHAVGTVHRSTSSTIKAEVAYGRVAELPGFIQADVKRGPREMKRDYDPNGIVTYYVLRSDAFRGRLLINSRVFERKGSGGSSGGRSARRVQSSPSVRLARPQGTSPRSI